MKKFKDILDKIPDNALISVSTRQLLDARHYKDYNSFLGLKCEIYKTMLDKYVIEFYKCKKYIMYYLGGINNNGKIKIKKIS